MNKLFRNEKGITLVELLAVLAISALIMISFFSIHIFIQNQYKSQSTEIKGLTDLTIAAKSITKDIRSATEISTPENTILIIDDDITYKYKSEDNILEKNEVAYIHNLEIFEVEKLNSKITLLMKSGSGKYIETAIVLREGDSQNGQSEEE